MHSTTTMVGSFTSAVCPQKLYLNHFSKRYFLNEIESVYNIDPHTELVLSEVYAAMGVTSHTSRNSAIPDVIPAKDLQIYRIPTKSLKQYLKWINTNRDDFKYASNLSSAYPTFPFEHFTPRREALDCQLLLLDLF